jgi:hypothetical protein
MRTRSQRGATWSILVKKSESWRRFTVLGSSLAVLMMNTALTSRMAGQSSATTKDVAASTLLAGPTRAWAADAAKNELIALHHNDSYLRYRSHYVSEKGDMVRDVVESKEGTVARLILKDGKPLSAELDEAERKRLNDMIASPASYEKHVKNSEAERRMADKLVPLMPDAMIYTYTPGQPQTGRNPGSVEIVMDYAPNPKWVAPSTEAEALTGLQGRIWIDAKSHCLVRMEGTVSHGVNFGWGMLAHIYPGGRLALNQTDAGNGRWIFTDFSMQLTVRALMVKTLNIKAHAAASDFQTLPPMSYQDAIRMMLNTPLPSK